MKKADVTILLAAVLSVVCVWGQACDSTPPSFMEVYGDSLPFIPVNGTGYSPDAPYTLFKDEEIAPDRTEIVFGEELELFYAETKNIGKFLVNCYVSKDGRYSVQYERDHDTIRLMWDNAKNAPYYDGPITYSQDELIALATTFAKSHWPILQDQQYRLEVSTNNSATLTEVHISRIINGMDSSETVRVSVSAEGEIVGWANELLYPEGIPQNMINAISALDMKLAKQSVEHHFDACAKNASKTIECGEFRDNWLSIGYDGTLSWCTNLDVTIDGITTSEHFYVIIPY